MADATGSTAKAGTEPFGTSAATGSVGKLQADDEATYGEDGTSEITSLASSVLQFRRENGRTYHAYGEGKYFMPNDEIETNRLDLQHNLCLLTQDGKLFVSPAGKDKPLKRVLDAGCGTGIWSVDFADEYPDVSVIGVDLSPIQPGFRPPNVEFFVDDLEADWTFSEPFDLIYLRLLTGSIKDWPRLFSQAFTNLAPGGYIELYDTVNPLTCDDGTLPDDAPVLRWNRLLVEASRKLGRPLDSVLDYKKQLVEAGFVNVEKVRYKWPMNPWPRDKKHKNLGAWTAENFSLGLEAVSLMLFTNVLGWSVDEVKAVLADVQRDVRNRGVHAYWPIYVVYAQKPVV
ncbi:S-adenosyl-L-methionine-dependent methyltransferase [Echria macrotheca]|uniref:S-adenosyl-L-methionine-dependent methyltransferase n=1 Tax=Echria macrotheca TaxID=438768 RepID=A0AAJ0F9B0_9PEZI|nr:S-adenosyl-L-methionine-dependent methyltransferase [Echria macrotheca]